MKKRCNTCDWWYSATQNNKGICVNRESPKKRELTNSDDICKAWEKKEKR